MFLKGKNGLAAPITWASRKLKRIVKSPMAAETMVAQDAIDYASLISSIICEIYKLKPSTIPVICVSDSKSLCDTVHTTHVVEDKGLMIDLCCLRQKLQQNLVNIKWMPSCKQLADCLTKSTASSELLLKIVAGEETIPVD